MHSLAPLRKGPSISPGFCKLEEVNEAQGESVSVLSSDKLTGSGHQVRDTNLSAEPQCLNETLRELTRHLFVIDFLTSKEFEAKFGDFKGIFLKATREASRRDLEQTAIWGLSLYTTICLN